MAETRPSGLPASGTLLSPESPSNAGDNTTDDEQARSSLANLSADLNLVIEAIASPAEAGQIDEGLPTMAVDSEMEAADVA